MRKNLIYLCSFTLLFGCGKKDKLPDPIPAPVEQAPIKPVLMAPLQNSLCASGDIISNTQAAIVLDWHTSANTDSYEVDIKNLVTGDVTKQAVTTNQFSATLLRGTPYSWFVISKSNSTQATAVSDTWKFYIAGLSTTTYSPFPAAIVSPAFGQVIDTGARTVDLSWTGSDVDNDIIGYDVYFSTNASPELLKSGVTAMFLNYIAVISKTTYYWKIITTDSQGNTSDSGVYHFSTN